MTSTPKRRAAIVGALAVATLASAVLAGGLATAATPPQDPPPTWNAMEHEARRSLPQVQQEQEQVLNPREHEGHRRALEAGLAGRAAITGSCAVALEQAWADLGHFSDAMETWMLTTDTCRTP